MALQHKEQRATDSRVDTPAETTTDKVRPWLSKNFSERWHIIHNFDAAHLRLSFFQQDVCPTSITSLNWRADCTSCAISRLSYWQFQQSFSAALVHSARMGALATNEELACCLLVCVVCFHQCLRGVCFHYVPRAECVHIQIKKHLPGTEAHKEHKANKDSGMTGGAGGGMGGAGTDPNMGGGMGGAGTDPNVGGGVGGGANQY